MDEVEIEENGVKYIKSSVKFTLKDHIIEKLPIKNGRNNKTLNECIEEWHENIEYEF